MKGFTAVTAAVLVAIGVGVGAVGGLPAVNPAITARCRADLATLGGYVPMPSPTRLRQPFSLGGAEFLPPSAAFQPRVSADDAWRQLREGGPVMEPTATYQIILATVTGPMVPDSGGVDWVVLGTNLAAMDDGPSPDVGTQPPPVCTFGSAYLLVSSTSGRALMSGG